MTGRDDWEARNNAYLTAGLRWLRDRLPGGQDSGPASAADDGWWAAYCTNAPPGEDGPPAGEDAPPALELLGDRLGLSRFERLTLLLCAAMEFDPAMSARCAAGQAGAGQPTFALAFSILPDPA